MLDETKMSEIESAQGSKILQLALKNKQIAIAVLGQALLDEGGIGAQSITIYTNKGEAEHLWKIANSLGYALSLIHISEPTRRTPISYAVFCLKKKKKKKT